MPKTAALSALQSMGEGSGTPAARLNQLDTRRQRRFCPVAGQLEPLVIRRRSQWVSATLARPVYLQEFSLRKSVARVDSKKTLPRIGLIEYSQTDRRSAVKYCPIN